jgi:hypothetical protein
MSPPEPPRNPEHRSNNAILCFCLGVGLLVLTWFLGVGGVIAAALTGGDPAIVVGGIIATLGLVLLSMSGFVLMLVGGVWMVIRVIADQRGEASEKRYRDVER